MGDLGVLVRLISPYPQSLALAACGGKIVCSGCSAWLTDTCPAPPVPHPPYQVPGALQLPKQRQVKLCVVFGPRAPVGTAWRRWAQRTAPVWGRNVLVSAFLGLFLIYA